ncbi:MAG: Flp pilus assembly complex ATPase component TadA, partial [Chloroflexota bacterium]|nr:Flp pilus assembly complex ATPase component TadA [Chloroflexota bacterium]
MPTPPNTGELFQQAPRQTTALQEQAQQASKARGGNSAKQDSFNELKGRVQNRLIAELDPRMDLGNADEVRRTVEETFGAVLEAEGISLTRVERLRLFEAISAEILGFGPIEPLLKDPAITEIMINGPKQVYVEKGGKLDISDVVFNDDEHVMRVIDRIVSPLGRRIDESSPTVD